MGVSRSVWAFLLIVTACSLFVAACSRSSGDGSTRLEAAGESGSPVATTPTDAFHRLREAFLASTFSATYDETGLDTDGVDSTWTLHKSGPERLRLDLHGERDGDDVEIVVIDTEDGGGFCLRNAGEFGRLFGVAPEDGICFDRDPGEAGGELSATLEMLRSTSFDVTGSTRREIAGEDARCYDTRAPYDQFRTYCFANDGILLRASDETGKGVEAMDVKREVDAEAFDLPYDVHALPPLGAIQ